MRLDNRQALWLEIIQETPLCRNCLSHREKLAKAVAR